MNTDEGESWTLADGELWTLTFRVLPDAVPAAIRVRRLLKTALRRDRLRCVGQVVHDKQIEAILFKKNGKRSR